MSIRIGIIGAGGIGTLHAETASAVGAEIVSICDADMSRAERLASRFGNAKPVSSHAELLANSDIEAVVVAVPNIFHASIAIDALRAGKHVLLEKPMAITVGDCESIMCERDQARRLVQIGFVTRGAPAVKAARSLIESGRLGTIYHIKAAMYRRRGIPGLGRWFTTRDKSGGGVLIDLGVHMLDLVMHLSGARDPKSAYGVSTSTHGQPIANYIGSEMWAGPRDPEGVFDVEDALTAIVRFGGMNLELNVMWAGDFPQGSLRDGVVILGDRGGLHIEPWANKVALCFQENGYVCDVSPELGKADAWTEAWQGQFRSFASAVRNGAAPQAAAEDGRRVQAIIEAIYRSCSSGSVEAVSA